MRCGDRLGAGDSSVASAALSVSAGMDMGCPRAGGRRWSSVSEAEQPHGVRDQLAGGVGGRGGRDGFWEGKPRFLAKTGMVTEQARPGWLPGNLLTPP